MRRSYRCILVAFVGWLSLAASPPGNRASDPKANTTGQQEQSFNRIATAIEGAAKPDEQNTECPKGNDRRSSDLCAQWYAADAARSAANAAWALGIIGGLIAALTLFAAIHAARWAKKAAIETERAGDAARDALAHQIETTNKQLRAYVSMGMPTLKKIRGDKWGAYFPILNSGQTPATDVIAALAITCEPFPLSRHSVACLTMREFKVADIGPNGGERARYFEHDVDMPQFKDGLCFVYCLQISYTIFTGERIRGEVLRWISRERDFDQGSPSTLDDQHYRD